jgi:dCTP diphosphatase
MSKRDDETTIQELKELVIQFGRERHWERHHTPKNLSMNIAIEAAELMELFVWDRAGDPDPEDVADELADVLFNVLNFAQSQNIDIATAFMKKLQHTKEKYPTEKFNEAKDDLDEYKRIKKAYRSQKGKA